ncbi:MAG TPA: hypothetical protein PK156_43110 [Polyangium sp.]|nr:hypothetical protein [Polyangium sp.]
MLPISYFASICHFTTLALASIAISACSAPPSDLGTSSTGASSSSGEAGMGGTSGSSSGSTGMGGFGGTAAGGSGGNGPGTGGMGTGGAGMGGTGGGTCIGEPTCVCPEHGPIAGYSEHDGLREIDPAHFDLVDTGTWNAYAAAVDALGLPYVALDALNLNRTATKPDTALAANLATVVGYQAAFEWEAGDQNVTYWVPQGLTGGKAGNRDYVLVSWHYDETNIAADPNPPASGDKGIRLSLADVTTIGGNVPYRHALFVEPKGAAGFVSVDIHAGGMALYGSYLYVADTSRGVRVFDMTRIMSVSTSAICSAQIGKVGAETCAYGYAYAIPQVGGFYYPTGTDSTCRAKFSYLSLDTTSNPPSLISGEYDNDVNVGIYSRLLRFPLDATTHKLLVDAKNVVHANGAWYAGNRNVQGATAINGKFFLNATRYNGSLFTGLQNQASKVYLSADGKWGYMPEGIHYIPENGRLFINTEGHTNMPRIVYAVKASSVP